MDPLTHTLVGASLAATRLGEKTRLATPALVIGANLPDIDVFSYFRGEDFALGFRRGWTHGLLALVVLPALLAGLLLLWGRWRGRSSSERGISPGWLLALSYLACLTHPSLDWLNTYGMRWLMPFRDSWYYGDAVFIMDPWLWLILGLGWGIGRKPSGGSTIAVLMMVGLVIWLVGTRAVVYLPVVGSVFLGLLLGYLWRPKSALLSSHRVAAVGLVIAGFYIGAMISLHALTVSRVRSQLAGQNIDATGELLVGPTPANPLAWDVVVGTGGAYRWGRFDWRHGSRLVMSQAALRAARGSPYWQPALDSGASSGFLRWVRFPWYETENHADGHRIYLMDARYTRGRSVGFGGTVITLPLD